MSRFSKDDYIRCSGYRGEEIPKLWTLLSPKNLNDPIRVYFSTNEVTGNDAISGMKKDGSLVSVISKKDAGNLMGFYSSLGINDDSSLLFAYIKDLDNPNPIYLHKIYAFDLINKQTREFDLKSALNPSEYFNIASAVGNMVVEKSSDTNYRLYVPDYDGKQIVKVDINLVTGEALAETVVTDSVWDFRGPYGIAKYGKYLYFSSTFDSSINVVGINDDGTYTYVQKFVIPCSPNEMTLIDTPCGVYIAVMADSADLINVTVPAILIYKPNLSTGKISKYIIPCGPNQRPVGDLVTSQKRGSITMDYVDSAVYFYYTQVILDPFTGVKTLEFVRLVPKYQFCTTEENKIPTGLTC